MGSHRKPRTRLIDSPAARRGVVGFGAAALSATLLSQTAHADDDATEIERTQEKAEGAAERAAAVKKQVDLLHRQAGTATQHYNAAKEAADAQQEAVDELLEQAAVAAEGVNEARRTLGSFAAAQYRNGTFSDTAVLLLADDPRSFFDTSYTLGRATEEQQRAVDEFTRQREAAAEKRAEATEALEGLDDSQEELQQKKETVQGKLSTARTLLEELTEEEQQHLEKLEQLEREEAERKAEERREAERQRAAEEAAAAEAAAEAQREEERQAAAEAGSGQESGSGEGTGAGAGEDSGSSGGGSEQPAEPDAGKAAQVLAYAEAQLGKPYVWGAAGPNSFDCSGLTQGAWRAAGVEIPRVTYDQVNFGTKVSRSELRPGDLVFFYSDISHVGIYIGDGQMIHAPKPGENVRVESIDYMPWHSANRPA
ncbi:C40 family peptidase [Streptomyces sp. ACA25]|uniref:C40 family peptidase n=1 Tax=Streptomyces sp. ACA25 TaxID=3022596 RepID=UPI00230822DC|nr:C40 family peptidase [Streptomyces sp. ACA25]MDB1087384.1 C40 family peptidase [Streptomyces sp. ACA25]